MIRLRPNTTDGLIWEEVFIGNEYRLPDRMDGWQVIDIGAHIGSFTLAAIVRGAEHVLAFEPDDESAEVFDATVSELNPDKHRVSLTRRAVWSSGIEENYIQFGRHPILANPAANGAYEKPDRVVQTASLDKVLAQYAQPIDMLKVDAECSEYMILMSSRLLKQKVRRICGEWHTIPSDHRNSNMAFSRDTLLEHLRLNGFRCSYTHNACCPLQGIFWAAWPGCEIEKWGLQ